MEMLWEFKNVGSRNEKGNNATIVEGKDILLEIAMRSLRGTTEVDMKDILMIVWHLDENELLREEEDDSQVQHLMKNTTEEEDAVDLTVHHLNQTESLEDVEEEPHHHLNRWTEEEDVEREVSHKNHLKEERKMVATQKQTRPHQTDKSLSNSYLKIS